MAKKKSKKSNVSKILLVVALLLGVASVCMLFVPSVKWGGSTFTGLQTAFGYEKETDAVIATLKTRIFEFSFMNLLTFILALVGTIISLLNCLSNKPSKVFGFVGAVAFIVSAVFFFLAPQFAVPVLLGQSVKGSVELTLAIGSILGGVFTGIAGLSSLASLR